MTLVESCVLTPNRMLGGKLRGHSDARAYFEVLNVLDVDNPSYHDGNTGYSERRRVTRSPRIAGTGVTARS